MCYTVLTCGVVEWVNCLQSSSVRSDPVTGFVPSDLRSMCGCSILFPVLFSKDYTACMCATEPVVSNRRTLTELNSLVRVGVLILLDTFV